MIRVEGPDGIRHKLTGQMEVTAAAAIYPLEGYASSGEFGIVTIDVRATAESPYRDDRVMFAENQCGQLTM